MFLRSLTLSGFKSFAETTTLTFEPGVTVVVGPNGSGKSNVVDAIAWVLGAQGPRTLRGQRMDDVVFAGTDRRVALGRAQVTLVIDNESQTLPTQTAEVAITRTLYRSGESEYALNGTPCRLLDLQELLNDAGVGRQQHIIVAQGQITGVLAAQPSERRALIEEAAGVLKFRRRKERAERRLESTEANVTRLADLQRELRRQLRPLERQAEAARRHAEISSELADLQLYNAGRELAGYQQSQAVADARRAEMQAEQGGAATSLAETGAAIEAAQGQLAELTSEPTDRLSRVASLSERARGLIGQTYERMRSVERERDALLDSDVVATLTDEHTRLSEEIAELDAAQSGGGEPAARSGSGEVPDRKVDEAARHEEELDEASAAASEAQARLDEAAAAVREADEDQQAVVEELQRWIGRSEALNSAISSARDDSGVEALGGVPGVLGVLSDLLAIEEGFEAAAEAAAHGALSAVVVRDDGAASEALGALDAAGLAGSVISLSAAGDPGEPGSPAGSSPLGAGDELVRPHVGVAPDAPEDCHDRITALMDALIGHAVCVGDDWSAAYERACADRDGIFVTLGGDRFGPRSWRIGGTGAAAAEAAHQEAQGRIAELRDRHRERAAALDAARQAHRAALDTQRNARRAVESLRQRIAAVSARQAAQAQALEAGAAAQQQRRTALEHRLRAIAQRLAGHESSRTAASARLERSGHITTALDRLALLLSGRRHRLDAEADRLRARHEARTALVHQLSDRLDALRRERDAISARQESVRTELAALDVSEAERRTKRDVLVNTLRVEFDAEPETALAALPPPLPDGVTAKARERSLRADLSRIGPINPLALSEYEAASERHEFVASQLADVRASRRELGKVIRAIDAEIVSTFAEAFEDVARNFAELFGTLFPGGTGKLSLTDPDDLLACGVELDVRPAGKRVGRLSLLSGGERSLVALTYLFAVFRSRPSPFYVLDEVEAALDDVNLQRFLDLVTEFRSESQLVIVSHQRRTMESADVLYGVSMPPGGSSVVVSERPSATAALIAADGPLTAGEPVTAPR